MQGDNPKLKAAVFGPTGLVGMGVTRAWLDDPRVSDVRAVSRRPLPYSAPGLRTVECGNFLDLAPLRESLEGVDAVCYCLGRSYSQVRDAAEYHRITYDFALAAGRAVLAASPNATFHFVSGSGTSLESRMNWARVKAETEQALSELGLGGCLCWRPAGILHDVKPDRMTAYHRMGIAVGALLRGFRSLSVGNRAIGEAMLQATLDGRREGIIENREIRDLADGYRARSRN
ncbi:MAG: hypothetical protein OXG81_17575 [Acidobacteria bacterium]|nr:hypothetical protein [Acidobacteriota bacterium]MCY3971865.1 hypothetical protein [Acidobacteriota bacterium]